MPTGRSKKPVAASSVGTRWLNAKSCAVYLDTRPRTIYEWASAGLLPCVRISRRSPAGRGRHRCTLRFDRVAIDEHLNRLLEVQRRRFGGNP